jgi:malonyl-CoA O-methyltransferase
MTAPLPARAAYDEWAATYDAQANATRDLDAAVLRRAGLPLAGRDVIEIGAGTGKNTCWLAEHARSVLALDFSPAMLARARERVRDGHVRFALHDVTRPWPVADEAADIVVGNLVLEHVADLRPVFAEAGRALRPGGLLFVCELHPYRQLQGAQARFPSGEGLVPVEAYPHMVAEYVNGALACGFALLRLDEWQEGAAGPEAATSGLPRLLSALFRAPAGAAQAVGLGPVGAGPAGG